MIQWVHYIPTNFATSAYQLPWPAFLGILQSPEIHLALGDLVNMAAMIKSSHA
jgi:hypothetical protein